VFPLAASVVSQGRTIAVTRISRHGLRVFSRLAFWALLAAQGIQAAQACFVDANRPAMAFGGAHCGTPGQSQHQPADLFMVDAGVQSLLDRQAQFDKEAARAKAMLSRWLGNAADRPLAQLTLGRPPLAQGDLSARIEQHPRVESSSVRSLSRKPKRNWCRRPESRTGVWNYPRRSGARTTRT
jgi:hypothetical protein